MYRGGGDSSSLKMINDVGGYPITWLCSPHARPNYVVMKLQTEKRIKASCSVYIPAAPWLWKGTKTSRKLKDTNTERQAKVEGRNPSHFFHRLFLFRLNMLRSFKSFSQDGFQSPHLSSCPSLNLLQLIKVLLKWFAPNWMQQFK